MPFKETLGEYIRLENDGRDRDRQLEEKLSLFLLDLRTMLDVLNSALRNESDLQKSPLGQKLTSSIATLRASLAELDAQEKLSQA
jgi:hypothetical protein